MKAYDVINKKKLDVTKADLIDLMKHDRQIDMVFSERKSDDMGYLTWNAENWTCVDGQNRFMRCYSLDGRVLRDFTSHNIYDLENDLSYISDLIKQVLLHNKGYWFLLKILFKYKSISSSLK